MIGDILKFITERGLLSPTILAAALMAIVYFQSGVDAEQGEQIKVLQADQRVTSAQQAETAANLKATAIILDRIDNLGTKSEMQRRERELDRREGAALSKGEQRR